MKTCSVCQESKPLSEFYQLSHRRGWHARCKPCYIAKTDKVKAREAAKRYYDKNREKVIARVTEARKISGLKRTRKQRDPKKVDAHRQVKKHLDKAPCMICGKTIVHGHHDNYDRPLDVVWLCPKHHGQRHRSLDRIIVD